VSGSSQGVVIEVGRYLVNGRRNGTVELSGVSSGVLSRLLQQAEAWYARCIRSPLHGGGDTGCRMPALVVSVGDIRWRAWATPKAGGSAVPKKVAKL
jgi:hypothetical protein